MPEEMQQVVPVIPEPIVSSIVEVPKKSPWLLILTILLIAALTASSYLYWQNTQIRTQLAKSPSPTPSPSDNQAINNEQTTSWQTYTNPELSFSFQYPPTWSLVNEKSPRIISLSPNKTDKSLFVAFHKNINDIQKWVVDNQVGEIIEKKIFGDNEFTIIKGGSQLVSQEYAIVLNNLSLLRFVIEPFPNNNIDTELINQILSTFKFTSATNNNVNKNIEEAVKKYLVEEKIDTTYLAFKNIGKLGQHQDVYVASFSTLPPESNSDGEWLIVGKVGSKWVAPKSGSETTCSWVKSAGFTNESDIAYYGQGCPQ